MQSPSEAAALSHVAVRSTDVRDGIARRKRRRRGRAGSPRTQSARKSGNTTPLRRAHNPETPGSTHLTNVTFADGGTLTAAVPWAMDSGAYALTVVNPDGRSGSLSGAFAVTPGIGKWNRGASEAETRSVRRRRRGGPTVHACTVGLHRAESHGGSVGSVRSVTRSASSGVGRKRPWCDRAERHLEVQPGPFRALRIRATAIQNHACRPTAGTWVAEWLQ